MKINVLKSFILSTLFCLVILFLGNSPVYASTTTSNTLQDFQIKLNSAMMARNTTYSISYSGNNSTLVMDIPNAFNNIFSSDDYLANTIKSYGYSYNSISGIANINFTFTYWNTATMDTFVNTRVAQILSQITTASMKDYEKEKAIHDWIEANVAYDTTLVKHSDYDALVAPYKTVCQGYALLAYKMLNQSGINTRIETGLGNGEPHAWNLVLIDGAWYQLDTTWDDPIPDVAGRITYDYYNLTDAELKLSHSWTKSYPAATTEFGDTLNAKIISDPLNISIYQGLSQALGLNYLSSGLTVNNSSELLTKVQQAIQNNQKEIKVRYMSASTLYTDVYNGLRSISNITGYSYFYTDFVRSIIKNDVILDLKFSYNSPTSVSSISISSKTLNLVALGTTTTLTASILPTNSSNKNVIWSSSDSTVATVVAGIVKPIGGGTATITVTTADGGFVATCLVTVSQKVGNILLDKTKAYVKLGESDLILNATVNPSGATDKSLTWTSSNSDIATVDINGSVHAVSYGTVVITAKSVQDPTKLAKCTMIVPISATGVTLTGTATVKVGSTLSLVTVISPKNATIKGVSYSTSNENIATVSITGVVTPVAAGTAIITVTTEDGSFTGNRVVTVIQGVTDITLNKTAAYLKVGVELTLNPTVNPSNATDKRLIWTSDDPNIARVDANGLVHGVTYGTTIITVKSVQDSTVIATCTITVPIPVSGVALKEATTAKLGANLTLIPVITPVDATIRGVSFNSSDATIAKINSKGVITPVSVGTVKITVTSEDGSFTAICIVTVIQGVTGVTLDKATTYLKVGASDLILNAIMSPVNATDKRLLWTSSNPAIAKVDISGVVHAVAYGTATITAKSMQDATKLSTCTVIVPIPVTGLELAGTTTIKLGSTLTLNPLITPINATITGVSYSSSDVTKARVSVIGVVTAVAVGTTTITVTTEDGSFKRTCVVTVIQGVTSIILDKATAFLQVGLELKLNATINPTNATDKSLTWTSSNLSIATVDGNGVVHAVNSGIATIMAKSVQDSTKSTKCIFTITK